MTDDELRHRIALRALVDEYASAVDARDAGRFAGVFTPDGVLAIYEPDEPDAALVYSGADELRSVMGLLEPFSTTFHLMANHTCRVDGARAEGEVYCLANHITEEDDGPRNTQMVIRYRDTYVSTDAGWRIARRDVMRQWTEYHAAERARLVG